ncbi:hypothetical protein FACS1894120_1880 [Clostridia bacterium]|nr:hypothetical protein FACS1894120_1880 [Clostridia bacterium]
MLKNFMKKAICAALTGAVLLTGVPVTAASAAGAAKPAKVQKFEVSGFKQSDAEKEFEKDVLSTLENFGKEIDITKYVTTYGWSKKFVMTEYLDTLYDNPQIFYVGKSIKYKSAGTESKGITSAVLFEINYSFDKSQYAAKKAEVDKEFAKYVSYVSAGSTDVEKALFAHDYLVNHITYDVDSMNNKATDAPVATTVYSALVRRKAVCEGYAAAFKLAMNYFGIQSEVVTSEALNHAWNYIKIGGNWYHVDATKDDPITAKNKVESFGQVQHERFLVSDTALRKLDYKGWELRGLPAASSTTYDKGFWQGVESNIVKIKDKIYYLKLDQKSPGIIGPEAFRKTNPDNFNDNFFRIYTNLYEYSADSKKSVKLYTIDSTWYGWGKENASSKSWNAGTFASLGKNGSTLYFSDAKGIYKFDIKKAKPTTVKNLSKENGYCYGFVVEDGAIKYTVKKDAQEKDNFKKLTIA